jgi:mannitol-1-phosphate/altronate dehydrogenase
MTRFVKNKIMKRNKLCLLGVMFLTLFGCGEKTNQLIDNGGYYTVNISKNDKVVSVFIMGQIIDSLNVPEDKVIEMVNYTVMNADMNVTNKLTYELTKAGLYFTDTSFIGMIYGSAENSYGVKDMVSNDFYFNIKTFELTKTSSY